MIKVLIVDDSIVESELLSYILMSDPEISITGTVSSGEAAISMIKRNRPDVITMDINMPGINGFETTRKIMESTPVPIIIVSSSYTKNDLNLSFKAMEAGALAIIEKPAGLKNSHYEKMKLEFLSTVKQMSEIKVVLRKKLTRDKIEKKEYGSYKINTNIDIIAVGASTGGPQALQKFLIEISTDVKTPILIVQHISSGFAAGFAEWLSSTCSMKVKIPSDGEKIQTGKVYVAPDNFHMGVDGTGCIYLSDVPPIKNLKPAVSFLFRSVAESYGPNSIGVLLTGMGRDGAEELKLMRDNGAMTFAQDEESSIVFGMPGEAVKLGGAVLVLPPDEIAVKIKEILKLSQLLQ